MKDCPKLVRTSRVSKMEKMSGILILASPKFYKDFDTPFMNGLTCYALESNFCVQHMHSLSIVGPSIAFLMKIVW